MTYLDRLSKGPKGRKEPRPLKPGDAFRWVTSFTCPECGAVAGVPCSESPVPSLHGARVRVARRSS